MTVKLFVKHRLNYLGWAVLCLVIYIAAVTGFTLVSNGVHTGMIQDYIDQKMTVAASSLRYMLEPDFHDRATGPSSISMQEELRNRYAVSSYAEESGFKYLYTLVEKDGRFYFSAPTVTPQEAEERERWYFYPYDDIPEGFVQAFREKKTVFVNYADQWGKFRSVAIPQYSPHGRLFLACADCSISELNLLMKKSIMYSIITALFFFSCSIPVIILFRSGLRKYNRHLKTMNIELKTARDNLEKLVRERTENLHAANGMLQSELAERKKIEAVLQDEKKKLEDALANVKTLSGMLPICASCKKIRDDSGYWNQIENYIRDHSAAEFSHGICPDCAAKLYPNIKHDNNT